MASIKIEDLPSDRKISPEEMKAILGGGFGPTLFKYKLIDPGDDEKVTKRLIASTRMVHPPELV